MQNTKTLFKFILIKKNKNDAYKYILYIIVCMNFVKFVPALCDTSILIFFTAHASTSVKAVSSAVAHPLLYVSQDNPRCDD